MGRDSLGKMSMPVPPFVQIEHDEAGRKAYVTVEDREVKKQREMWGMYPFILGMGWHT